MASRDDLSIDLPVPSTEAFPAACRALTALGLAVTAADPATGIVSAADVDLYIQPATATTSTVITRAEWAQDKRNAARLSDALHQQLALAARPASVPMVGAPAPLPPPPDPPSAAALQAPGWHPDPSGRFHHRWWDGHRWTAHVSTDGVPTTDSLAPPS